MTGRGLPGPTPDLGRPEWRRVGWLVALGVASSILFIATYLIAVHTRRGRLLDGASLRGAAQSRSSVTDLVERLLDVVSVAALVIAILSLVIVALLRARGDLAVAAVVVVVGSNLTSQVLKRFVLTRPDFGLTETTPATLNSLPSGHSTVAFSIAVGMLLVSPPRLRPLVAVLGAAYASCTAIATLSAGWHRPSDSVAAFFVVTVWATGAQVYITRRRPWMTNGSRQPPGRETVRRMTQVSLLLLSFSLVIVLLVVLSRLDAYTTWTQVSSYVASSSAMAGTACGLMAALAALTGPPRPIGLSAGDEQGHR